MADVYFKCACGRSLAVDERGVGLTVKCVDCGQPVKVPEYELEFACEHCQGTLLAPITVGGDWIKCTLCGHRMTVPRPIIEAGVGKDEALAEENAKVSTAKLCMDALMCKRAEFQAQRRTLPEPPQAGSWFRLAILAGVLVVMAGLIHRFIQERPVMPEKPDVETLAPKAADMTALRPLAPERPVPGAAKGLVASEKSKGMIPEAVRVEKMTGKFIPPPAGEAMVVTREPPRIRKVPTGPMSAKVPARNLRPTPAKPGAVAGKAPDAKVTHPALPEVVGESQKLNALINYKTGPEQSKEFFDRLQKSMGQINTYTQTHSGKDLDDFYWSTTYWLVYGYAIKTARSYKEAEKIMRQGWALLEGIESDESRAVPRTMLSMGVNLAQDWVKENPLECALLLDELEGMAQEMGDDKVGDIWRLNAPGLQVRFLKYAGNVPEEKRAAFVQRHKQRLERYLLDDSIRRRNRAATLRGWIVFLDKYGSLTDALPVIHEWQKRYGDKMAEMNYYFARFWVELYGEGDWDKATTTVRLATRAAQRGGKLFDEKNYVKLTQLYYDLLWWPGYELKRQRTIERNKTGHEELKTAFYKEKVT